MKEKKKKKINNILRFILEIIFFPISVIYYLRKLKKNTDKIKRNIFILTENPYQYRENSHNIEHKYFIKEASLDEIINYIEIKERIKND